MDTIKTEPEDVESEVMEEGDPLGLHAEFDIGMDTDTQVKVELEEDAGSYQAPQVSASYLGYTTKQEIEENDMYSSDNSESSDSNLLKPWAIRKRRDSDEDYVHGRKKKSNAKSKRYQKKKDISYVPKTYPPEIEDKVACLNITEEERANDFTKTLSEIRIKSQYICEFCALRFQSEKLLQLHNKVHVKKADEVECDICHSYMKSDLRLKVHRRRHYTRYQCKECNLWFINKDRAMLHVTDAHVPRTFDCPHEFCGKSFKRPRDLQWHLTRHPSQPYKCVICSSIFKSRALLNKHKRRSHPVGWGSVPCPVCSQNFATAVDMLNHRDSEHQNFIGDAAISMELIQPCGHCELTFLTRRELVRHLNATHADVPGYRPEYICELCDRSYSRQNSLNGHIRRMHCFRVKRFECDHCHRLYYTKPEVRAHIMWSHMAARGGFACACGRVFRALGRLRSHVIQVHGERPKDKEFQCGVCGNRFETNYLLKRHTQRHFNQSYPCPECDMQFRDRNYVQIHYKIKHLNMTRAEINAEKNKRKPMTVDRCSQVNRKISVEDVKALTGVQELVIPEPVSNGADGEGHDTAENSFACQDCGKIFKTNALLRRHSKVHSGTTYPCSHCDMRFKDKRYVQVHYQLRHLNMTRADLKKAQRKRLGKAGDSDEEAQKKYGCQECGKYFATKSLLNRHVKIHTDVTYPCSECDTVFKTQSYVKIHYNIKHLGMTWDEAKLSSKMDDKMARKDGKRNKTNDAKERNNKKEKNKTNSIVDEDGKETNGSDGKVESESDEESTSDESTSDDDDESVSLDDTTEESDDENHLNEERKDGNYTEEEIYVPSTSEVPIYETEVTGNDSVSNLGQKPVSEDHIDSSMNEELTNDTGKGEKLYQVPTFDTFEELIGGS